MRDRSAILARRATGRLKVFRSCRNWLDEFRIFARDETGKVMNEQKFHLMAATRYLFLGAMDSWKTLEPKKKSPFGADWQSGDFKDGWPREDGLGWMN